MSSHQNYFIYAVSNNYPKRIPKDYLKGLTLLQLLAGNTDMVENICMEQVGSAYLAKSLGIVVNTDFHIIPRPEGFLDPNLIVLAVETRAKRLLTAAKSTEDLIAILPHIKALLYGYSNTIQKSTHKPAHKELYIPTVCSNENIGAKLLTTATEYASQQGYDTIKLEAMVQVIGFYYRLGFRFTSPYTESSDFDDIFTFRLIDDEFKDGGFDKITPKTIKEKYFSKRSIPPSQSQINEKLFEEIQDFAYQILCENVSDTSYSTYMKINNIGAINMELFISDKMKNTPLYRSLFTSEDVVKTAKDKYKTLTILPSYSRLPSRSLSTRRSSFHEKIKTWSKTSSSNTRSKIFKRKKSPHSTSLRRTKLKTT